MARKPRIYFPGAFYHAMLRGNDGKQIFFSDEDREYFYFLLNEGIKRYGYRIHAFCLMNNHIHLAVQIGDISLSKVMQNLSFRYTRRINQLQKKVGHLFQGRFKAIVVDADNYLVGLIRYIHLNPVRAKMVNQAEDYFWSSHRAYLGLENISWLTHEYVLNYFDNSRDSAVIRYSQFMQDEPEESLQKEFRLGNQNNYAVLGNDEFLLQLKNIPAIFSKPHINLEDLVQIICSHYSIDACQLKNAARTRIHAKFRAIIAWLAKEFNICTFNEVAIYFKRDATGLTRMMRRLEGSAVIREELIACKELIEKSVCQA